METKTQRDKILWLLQKNNLTQAWLMNRLEQTRGISVCKTVMSDILRGVRKSQTANDVITASLEILEDYEKWASNLAMKSG